MIIFYDFEIFKHNWLVVFLGKGLENIIVDDVVKFKEFYTNHKEDIFVGYNSRHYDQYIFKALLLDMDPYDVSKYIIDGGQGWQFSRAFNNIELYNFDIKTTLHSLKELEAFMGNDIEESSVSFDIDRQLTKEELESTIKYCRHDVEQTVHVFKHRIEEFNSQKSLLAAFNMKKSNINKTKAQLSAQILGAQKIADRKDEFDFMKNLPNTMRIEKYTKVLDWYSDTKNHSYKDEKDHARQLNIDIDGVPHVFGYGGLHGAKEKYNAKGIIVNMDVASYYPALMIEYNYVSRNVEDPRRYREIRDTRIKLKAAKDPMQNPYKIVLNSTFGASKARFNNLYDPLMANCICISGQLLLLDLIERLSGYWELIQSNTDGLIGKVSSMPSYERVKKIAAEWEQRTRMVLEFELFERIYQKDVNNYVIVNKDNKYKSKGSYVKKLNPIDNDLPIVNKAIINHLVHNIPVEQTINECNELIMFQKVNKLSSKYKLAMHGSQALVGKCIRSFASLRPNDKGLFKVKNDNSVAKIASTPENCFIDNGNIIGKTTPTYIDKQWYINLANERIVEFIGG